MNWGQIILKSEDTIQKALEIINSEALRIALVVDDNEKLIGVITDGDIRRGILNGLSLTESVGAVMTTNPVTAEVGTSKRKLSNIMGEKGILSIPLIDDFGKIAGLETLHSVSRKSIYKNPVFIMAGGFGTRLRPLTDSCPKPMLHIVDRPILEITLKSFIKAGFERFYISTHYMPEKITEHFGDGSKFGVEINYIYENEPLGTGGALGLLPEKADKSLPLILINGDILTNVDFQSLLDFHNTNNAEATMCVREYDYQIPYGVIEGVGSRVVDIKEKPIQRFFVNAGIYVLSPNIYSSVPSNHHLDMPELLERNMNANKDVLMFPIHEYWLDIGRMEDFNRAQSDIHSLKL
ncbi:nucleotidyltransferase family protein [Marinomonas mediterranea]|uniref:Nucleotidyl transferase n=1 Tax=Marinomonas mediterranea (strain ATCC 700492 / JCM 21426 / NBRC 103028 / MMB-1) TaxID=717774 RepID=F2K4B9_MARM1|nr:nucleotidyltransferase family protein [Marinomonas mediterranea]ADZ92560.1 Nucleotidyl transferase [Marinomonas mediterranea MMB-1]WCN10504.1 CBS domain-containing protein [Marinomonas mediterranea]WCN14554.1 CBS domain-containing protein [Marinomonas mediterranea]WCN18604.1 CBS domain-containing protein [Marinomonas mediterranea MMB-1]